LELYAKIAGTGDVSVVFDSGYRDGINTSDDTTNREPLTDTDRQALSNGKTSIDKSHKLHALLKVKEVKSPYLLVVHSISSFDAVSFSIKYYGY